MPPTDVESPPDDAPAKPLEYVRASAPVTRRQFRFLLLLTLLNTILLAAFVAVPSISPFLRSNWQEYQAKRKLRQQQQQRQAFIQQLSTFTAPADQVVYEENPMLAAKLLASSEEFSNIRTNPDTIVHLTPQPWQPPIMRKEPPLVSQLRPKTMYLHQPSSDSLATILLHALTTPSGQRRLVWVNLSAEHQLLYTARSEGRRDLQAHYMRKLNAYVIDTESTEWPPSAFKARNHTPLIPAIPLKTTVTWTKGATWENGQIAIDSAGLFRIYAGQVDPADPSHFTIDYTLDEQRNTIDGYLRSDNTIQWIPRAGRIIVHPQGHIWDPFAAPTTNPSK